MALLKFHFSFSVLCLLTTFVFLLFFRERIRENGWGTDVKGGKLKRFLFRLRGLAFFTLTAFLPIFNFIMPFVLYNVAFHKNEKAEETT